MQHKDRIEDTDVLIIGAGIVGCSAALMIRACLPNLKVVVLEQGDFAPPGAELSGGRLELVDSDAFWANTWRVSALGLSTRAVFESLGLWSAMVASGVVPFHDMYLRDSEGTGRLHLNAKAAGEPLLGYILENDVMLRQLRLACLSDSGVDCRSWQKVETLVCAQRQAFTQVYCSDVSGSQSESKISAIYRAPLVISAEGRQSVARQQLAFPVSHRDYQQQALVCQVKTEHPHRWVVWQDFLDTGPLAFLPLSVRKGFDPAQEVPWPLASDDERYCSIVWTLDTPKAEQVLSQERSDPAIFAKALSECAPPELGRVERCSTVRSFPLAGFLAQQLQKQGVVLVGDSAHGYHPMAGQGLNVGLVDVAVLVDQLVLNDSRFGYFAAATGLRRYERLRRAQHLAVFELTSSLQKLYAASPWWLRVGRNLGLEMLNKFDLAKQFMVRFAHAHTRQLPERYRAFAHSLPF